MIGAGRVVFRPQQFAELGQHPFLGVRRQIVFAPDGLYQSGGVAFSGNSRQRKLAEPAFRLLASEERTDGSGIEIFEIERFLRPLADQGAGRPVRIFREETGDGGKAHLTRGGADRQPVEQGSCGLVAKLAANRHGVGKLALVELGDGVLDKGGIGADRRARRLPHVLDQRRHGRRRLDGRIGRGCGHEDTGPRGRVYAEKLIDAVGRRLRHEGRMRGRGRSCRRRRCRWNGA